MPPSSSPVKDRGPSCNLFSFSTKSEAFRDAKIRKDFVHKEKSLTKKENLNEGFERGTFYVRAVIRGKPLTRVSPFLFGVELAKRKALAEKKNKKRIKIKKKNLFRKARKKKASCFQKGYETPVGGTIAFINLCFPAFPSQTDETYIRGQKPSNSTNYARFCKDK